MNIWKRDRTRKIIFACLLTGITLSYTVSILFYTPRLLAGEIPEGGFPDILLTFSLLLFIVASGIEKQSQVNIASKEYKNKFNFLYVSRVERIIPALCLSLIVLVLFYKRNHLENEIITVLALLMIPFVILTALFEWSSYRSESWFLFMLSRTPMGIQITDKNMTKTLFANKSFCDLFNTTKVPPDTIISQAPEHIRSDLLNGFRTGEEVDKTELILKRPDSSRFHAQIKITPVRYYSRDIIIYWISDITERKKFEEQILRQRDTAETSNRYRGTLLENISSKMLSGYIIGTIKEAGNSIDLILTGMNRQAIEILGADENSLNKSFSQLFPNPSPLLIETIEKVLRTDESSRIEIFSRRLGKHLLIVMFKTSKDEIVCLINDITETRKTEKELIGKEREIHNLMANLPGMAYRCLNDSDWTMLFVSQGSIGLSGFTPEEITKGIKPWNDIIHPDDRGNLWLTVQKAINEKSNFHAEYRIIAKHGEIKYIWEKGTGVYDDSGRLLFLEGFMLDVTKQVEAETALRQSEEKLRQTEKLNAVSQMAGGIAHDLNNNLMAIQSLSSLIEMKTTDQGLKKYTDSINEVIGKASRLIDKLETFAKKKDLAAEVLSINFILENIASLLKDIFPENIKVNILLNAGKDRCRGDQIQLDNAFLYICMNSKEAMPMGGSLTIKSDNIYLNREFFNAADQIRQPGEYLRITITDTGSGIEKQDINRIFEPFFTTKPVGKGTGLSLSAVFGTIESHHGIITVNSESGNGASFIIYLPIA
jgi:PAS domain S-box-containing protein